MTARGADTHSCSSTAISEAPARSALCSWVMARTSRSPRHRPTSSCVRWQTPGSARGSRRPSSAGREPCPSWLSAPRSTSGGRGRNSSPATGPLTAVAALDRELLTVGGKADLTRFAGRHALKAGVDAVRLRPEEQLSYNYSGFSSLSHLLGLPHLHFTGGTVNFAGREAGGQLSAYVQDGIQLGARLTTDVGVRLDHYGPGRVGDTCQPACQCRVAGRRRGRAARVVQPFLRSARD